MYKLQYHAVIYVTNKELLNTNYKIMQLYILQII